MEFKPLENQSAMICMINYCLNTMRKRTIDEQLQDFSEIMQTSLKLQISYGKTDLEVKYEIGPHTASVRGLNETESVQQCKLDILHAIRVFCCFTNNPNKRFHRRQYVNDEIENGDWNVVRDVYSEMRLIGNRKYYGNNEKKDKISEDMVLLIDPEVDQLKSNAMARTTCNSASSAGPTTKSPLILTICYSKTELKVTYQIGRYSASVVGAVESTCLRQCRMELLDKFKETRCDANTTIGTREISAGSTSSEANKKKKTHCELGLGGQKTITTSLLVRKRPEISSDSNAKSTASPAETAKTSDLKKTHNETDGIVNGSTDLVTSVTKVDERTRGNSTDGGPALPAVLDPKGSVNVTDVDTAGMTPRASYQTAGINTWGKYIFDSNENFLTVNMNGSSSDGPSKNDNDIKTRSSNVPKGSQAQTPRTTGLSTIAPSTSYRPMGLSGRIRSAEPVKKSAIDNVAEMMDNLWPTTLSASAETLLNILVEINGTRFQFERVMNAIVQKAIDKPEKSCLYAQLCSETNRKALADVRDDVRLALPGIFKDELMKACVRVLDAGKVRNPEALDADAYVRTLGACKFMGEIFVCNSFKIIGVIMWNIGNFIKAPDAHSLECLCVLLTTMGPRFERINTTSTTQMSPQQVYFELERCAIIGYGRRILPERTLYMINELLRAKHDWIERHRPTSVDPSSFARMQSTHRDHHRNNNNNRPARGFTSLRFPPNDVRSPMWRSGRTQNPEHGRPSHSRRNDTEM